MQAEPPPDAELSQRNPERFVFEHRDYQSGKLALRVRVPMQHEDIDFRWYPAGQLSGNANQFFVVRPLGNFEIVTMQGETLLTRFFPPIILEVPYDALDVKSLADKHPGRSLELAYLNDRKADNPSWVLLSAQQDLRGVTFQRLGDERGGLLVALLYDWTGCQLACGG